jgi:hypothetical protein
MAAAPCAVHRTMMDVVTVARSLSIFVLGRDIPLESLRQLTAGKKLIPEVQLLLHG